MKRLIALFTGALCFFCAQNTRAQNVTISQIDPGRLLFEQSVRLYVDLGIQDTSSSDAVPTLEVWETGDGSDFRRMEIKSISRKINAQDGISFFFLLDNSGSMWNGLDNEKTDDVALLRMTHAKAAIRSFLAEISSKDRVGLAVFNTRYWRIQPASPDISRISQALEEIQKPTGDDAYTELYLSLERALEDFAEMEGRKVLIVLSDGENFPYFEKTGRPNPETGKRNATPDESIDTANREGISCYAVRFAENKDKELKRISSESGGSVFDAANQEELSSVYRTIRERVLKEYALDYRAGMARGEKRFVKVVYRPESGSATETTRFYYSGTILGWNSMLPERTYALFVLIPLAIWLAFLFFKLERETTEAGIQLIYGPKGTQTKAFKLGGARTVIGGDDTADITIAGNPSLRSRHATILFDKTQGHYTIVGDTDITVNNKTVTTRKLESGDVINMAGTVVVFDKPLTTVDKPRKRPK